MRTVADPRGVVWICLELPEAHDAPPAALVEVECNSGAERLTIHVARGWDSDLDDEALVRTIFAARPVKSE